VRTSLPASVCDRALDATGHSDHGLPVPAQDGGRVRWKNLNQLIARVGPVYIRDRSVQAGPVFPGEFSGSLKIAAD